MNADDDGRHLQMKCFRVVLYDGRISAIMEHRLQTYAVCTMQS